VIFSWYKHVYKPWWGKQKALKQRRGGWRSHFHLSTVFAKIGEDPYVRATRKQYVAKLPPEGPIVFQEKHKNGKITYYKYFRYFEGRMVGVEILPIETIKAFERK
jgi:hypothetical protein